MKFTVKATTLSSNGNGRARLGVLELANCPKPIETPSLVLSTRKALPAFIPPDILPSLDAHLVQFSPLHFLEGPSAKTISTIGGIHSLVGLHRYGLIAVPRDSTQSIPRSESSNKHGASFDTPCGRKLVNALEYMGLISSMKPNAWTSLADEVPAWVSQKRNKASVDRTITWLDQCISLSSMMTGGGGGGGCDIFGAVVGGSSVMERQRCAREIVKRKVLSGYWLGGFGLGETMDERPALLDLIMDILPEEKPRMIGGLGHPEEILQGVAAGIDVFDSEYINHLTVGGFALVFSPDIRGSHGSHGSHSPSFQQCDMGSDSTKINLRAVLYRNDTSPIVEKCECYTCLNHMKAYINHLLNVHEMLAHILLDIHNTHHYLSFFHSIRRAIEEGKFEQFRKQFLANRLT